MTEPELPSDEQVLAKSLYDDFAERAVLGCMLAYPAEVIEEVIDAQIEAADFFVPAHKIVHAAIMAVYQEGSAVDSIMIHRRLEDWGKAQEVGSPGLLAETLTEFKDRLHVGSYIRILKEKTLLRDMENVASGIITDIREMPDSVASVLDRAEGAITRVIDSVRYREDVNYGLEIQEAAMAIFEHADSGGGLRGLPTGFRKMDELTMGWCPGELIVVAARPGKGKTALMLKFLKTLVGNQFNPVNGNYELPGYPGQVFSMEMRRHELYMRQYAMEAGVGLADILKGNLSETDRARITAARHRMAEWPLWIDDTPRMEIGLMRSRLKRAVRLHGVRFMIADYLQLATSRRYPANRVAEVGDVSGQLKAMARENGIPIIALAQLNRQDLEEDAEPQIHTIRDSGAIEQDADKVILLHAHRPNSQNRPTRPGVIHYDAIIPKQRNAPPGRVPMDFHAYKVYFSEADDWGKGA